MDKFYDLRAMRPGGKADDGGPAAASHAHFSLGAAAAAIWPETHARIGDDVLADIAAQAAAADESGTLSAATLDRLRSSGYFGLPVPEVLQGGGAGLLECAAVQRRLAKADPALAIAANMHLFSLGMAVEHWRRHRDSCGLLLESVATQGRIVASAFGEPGLGGALLRSTMQARRVEGGYRLTGTKSPCSLAACCDLICFQMQADAPPSVMMAVMPAKAQGIRVKQTWDALGMRGSGSDTLMFEDCLVPDELIYHRSEPGVDNDEVFAAGIVWFCVTTTVTYLGVTDAVRELACAGLHQSTLHHPGAPRALLPSVQGQLGELLAPILALEAGCAAIAERLDGGRHDPRDLVPIAVAAKHQAVEACIRAVEGMNELAGGSAFARTATLARLWRDVQAARFHPPNRLTARQLLGKWALALPFSFELDERPNSRP